MKLSTRFRLATAASALVLSTSALAGPIFINVLTGGTSGVYYPLGVALSQEFSAIEGAKPSVQATKASVENLNLLQKGRGELAFALGDSVSNAWQGVAEAGFKAPLKNLRAIAGTYQNYIQVVANQETGIQTLADLKGKRVSVGAPKSGTELNARAIFKAAGMSYEDLARVEFLPYAESVELIKNRQLDATLQSSGLGMAAIRDLATTMAVTFVEIPEAVVSKIGSPVYQPGVIPAGTYEGQDTDVSTVAITNLLVSHKKVPEEVAYQMTKLMFENLDDVVKAHAAAKAIRLDKATKNLPIPLHPGAERYYKEAGVL